MPINACQRTAMAAAIAACFPAAALAAGVARVDFASGNVAAIAPNGQSRALSRGSEIQVGETVSTQQGRAQLRFADGAYMSLQPQTEFKVEEFKYSGKQDPSDNIVMNLLKGGMRTITGLIGRTNRNAYRLKTEVATIGIRGTEYSVRYTNSIELFVADGLVSVDNQSGSFTVPGGAGVMVAGQGAEPQQTDQKPVLPPETPVEKQVQEPTKQISDPVNPIQESQSTTANLLTGTITGSYAGIGGSSPFPFGPQAYANVTPITLDSAGRLVSFMEQDNGFLVTSGTASVESSGNDGVIAWGRWMNGSITADGSPVPLSQAFHYVVGLPATNIPTTTATYSILGSSVPTFSGFTSVVVEDSFIKVDFTLGQASFNASFKINGSPVTTQPCGGVPMILSGALLSQSGGGSLVGLPCGSIGVSGALFGDGAIRAGMAYHISEFGNTATGTIGYTKTGP